MAACMRFLLTSMLVAAPLALAPVLSRACDQVAPYIVDLSQDTLDLLDPDNLDLCTRLLDPPLIRQCIADQIDAALPENCEDRFDIYVPGTAAEHGAWKQFNRMFVTDNGRTHLVLKYDDARVVEGINYDGAFYDKGVRDARLSLTLLIDALRDHFGPDKIRVFGHSKGSHAVSVVATDPSYASVDFYAFAQPGRTVIDVDTSPGVGAGLLGQPGFIEKLSPNLVGITWKNDEVQYFVNDPFSIPEIWSFPGYIWQENTGGGGDASEFRIDHHNNYGGAYSDGVNGNDWRDGEGTVGGNYPYCATGDRYALDQDECDEQRTDYSPWFWGTPECEAQAYRMMARGEPGDRFAIGYSGPRKPGTCEESQTLVRVSSRLRYRFNLPDKDCVFRLRFGFRNIHSGKLEDSFYVSGTTENDQIWHVFNDALFVPYHFHLEIEARLIEDSQGWPFPDCESLSESEAYISELEFTLDHPGTGQVNDFRTIIGHREGRGSLFNLDGWDNVAWEQLSGGGSELKMYYWATFHSISIEGPTDPGNEGTFRKRVHLLD